MSSFADARENAPDLALAKKGTTRSRMSGARSRWEFVRIAVVAAETAILTSHGLGLGVAGASAMPVVTTPGTTTLSNPGPATTTHNIVTITGVVPTQSLVGTVNVQYVLDNGAVKQIPSSLQYGGTTHNCPLALTVQKGVNMEVHLNLPSSAQWPAQASGTKEIQVVTSLSVLDNGNLIGTLDTGQQYTVFCLGTPKATKKPSGTKH
jgi:hypothetical protein